LMTNRKMWEDLDDSQRAILLEAHKAASAYSEKVINAAAEKTVESVIKQGAHFIKWDPAPFVKKMNSFYMEQDKAGELPKGFLEAVNATR